MPLLTWKRCLMSFNRKEMAEMQCIIDAERSDLFDVLAYIAYALPTKTREQRVATAHVEISARFGTKQQVFLNFVLAHYVSEGVRELDQKKLKPLLRLRYNNSIADAVADLGKPEEIGKFFADFQQYLYVGAACGVVLKHASFPLRLPKDAEMLNN